MDRIKTAINIMLGLFAAACLMLTLSACSQQPKAIDSDKLEMGQTSVSDTTKIDDEIEDKSSMATSSAQEQLYTLEEVLEMSKTTNKYGGHQYFAREGDLYYPLDTTLCDCVSYCYDVLTEEKNISILTPYPAGSSSPEYKKGWSTEEVTRYYETAEEADSSLAVVSEGTTILTTNSSNDCLIYPLKKSLYRSPGTIGGWSFVNEIAGVEVDGEDSIAEILNADGIRSLHAFFVADRPRRVMYGTYQGTEFVEDVIDIDIPCWETTEVYHSASGGVFRQDNNLGIALEVEKTKNGYFSISLAGIEPGRYAVAYTSNDGGGIFAIEIR